MARMCQITGKKAMVGNKVSHSNRKSKTKFQPNLMKKRLFLEDEDRWVVLTVSTNGLRTISKIGLKAALTKAKVKGFITSY